MELLTEHFPLVMVISGSFLGSIKSSMDENKYTFKQRLVNFLIGVYCGISLGLTYMTTIETGYLGLIALTGAMIGTNILEVISDLAPELAKKFLRNKFE